MNILKKIFPSLLIFSQFYFLFAVNYSEDISSIIYNNCSSCHRPGEIGSFLPLTNYQEVYSNRDWIAYAISSEDNSRHGNPIMPPWPPDMDYSTLLNERYLEQDDIDIFMEWIIQGGIQGDPSNEASFPEFPDDSQIGTPDIILEMEEDFQVEGNFEDSFRCFVFETGYTEEMYFTAMEVRPGNNQAVHHAVIVAAPPGSADNLEDIDDEYGYDCFGGFGPITTTDLLGGFAPGTSPIKWGNGLAQSIPAGWDIIVQMHYAPVNEDMQDRSKVNIFLYEGEPERVIESFTMIDPTFMLPPNQITEVYNSLYVSTDVSVVSFFPHSHLIGKSWEVYATSPPIFAENDTIPIIRINEWDFDWQNFYYPEYMLHIPEGYTIHAHAVYDNTSNNPDNPNDPPQYVFWGDGTTDEMFFLPISYVPYQDGDENIYLGSDMLFGDVNLDGSVDVLDVVVLVNYILGNISFDENQIIISDTNQDGSLDVMDIVILVGSILD